MRTPALRRAMGIFLTAAALLSPAYGDDSLKSSPHAPRQEWARPPAATVPPAQGRWVPGLYLHINMGCLKKWICDCGEVNLPRGTRLERTPSERTAGICKAGPRGECAVCNARPPKKKCECKPVPR